MSLIDKEYRDKLIQAIDKYEKKHVKDLTGSRALDCSNLRMMIDNKQRDGVKFKTVADLSAAIDAYLSSIVTGFDLLKMPKLHVPTGHSELRKLVKSTMTAEERDAIKRETRIYAEAYEYINRVSELHDEIKELQDSYHHERERADVAESNSRRLERQLKRTMKENAALKVALEVSMTKVNGLNLVCANLQRESASAKEAQFELQGRNADLEQQLDTVKKQQLMLKRDNTDLKDRMSRMESMLESFVKGPRQQSNSKTSQLAGDDRDPWFEPMQNNDRASIY